MEGREDEREGWRDFIHDSLILFFSFFKKDQIGICEMGMGIGIMGKSFGGIFLFVRHFRGVFSPPPPFGPFFLLSPSGSSTAAAAAFLQLFYSSGKGENDGAS